MSMNDRKEPEASSSTESAASQAAAADPLVEESCIGKIFHMSLRSYNVLKQFLGFSKHCLIWTLEIFMYVTMKDRKEPEAAPTPAS